MLSYKNALVQELGRGHPFNLPTFPNEQFVLCVSDKEVAMAQGFVAKAMQTGKEQRYLNAVKGNLVSIRLKCLHNGTGKLWTKEQKAEPELISLFMVRHDSGGRQF